VDKIEQIWVKSSTQVHPLYSCVVEGIEVCMEGNDRPGSSRMFAVVGDIKLEIQNPTDETACPEAYFYLRRNRKDKTSPFVQLRFQLEGENKSDTQRSPEIRFHSHDIDLLLNLSYISSIKPYVLKMKESALAMKRDIESTAIVKQIIDIVDLPEEPGNIQQDMINMIQSMFNLYQVTHFSCR